MTAREANDFRGYLRNCTNDQVMAVLDKEREAGRPEWVLAAMEAEKRGLYLEGHQR
jgi:hypothetical protein